MNYKIETKADLRELDERTLLAVTMFAESNLENPKPKAQEAVLEVVFNYSDWKNKSIHETILKPFFMSYANETESGKLDAKVIKEIKNFFNSESLKSFFFNIADNFLSGNRTNHTNGATNYLNEELTKQIRADGKLPDWFFNLEGKIKIGNHTFGRDPGFFLPFKNLSPADWKKVKNLLKTIKEQQAELLQLLS